MLKSLKQINFQKIFINKYFKLKIDRKKNWKMLKTSLIISNNL